VAIHSVTAERASLSEASINGLRSTRDGLKVFGDKPHMVPMTCEYLSLGRQAHSHYFTRLEEEREVAQKKKKEKEEKVAKELEQEKARAAAEKVNEGIVEKEKKLSIAESKHSEMMEVGTELLKDANAKLREAMKT